MPTFPTSGPPHARVVFLPDGLFFCRPIPVSVNGTGPEVEAAAAPAAAAPGVGSQVELAFETLAPFPLAQLYYGYFWSSGEGRALAYAAYRRRFTTEQADAWSEAELVLPSFASVVGARPGPATTVVLHSPEGLTAVHWADSAVPSRVVFRSLAGEVTDEMRAAARDALLREFESKNIVDVTEPPAAQTGDSDGEFNFTCGTLTSKLTASEAAALDVRDKEVLAHLRRSRNRDVLMWRTIVGCLVAFLILLLGEAALFAGGLWQSTRRQQIELQAPAVERIQSAQEIANHIEDLRTKRLLTMEMLVAISSKRPPNTYFTTVSSTNTNLYTLQAQGETSNPAEISLLQDALQTMPQIMPNGVEIRQTGTSNKGSNFILTVKFKPNALKPS
ncbi:MAG TPA: hypothetical protein VGL42_08895 [Opitutaceae bacterium]|jgi:hypothetical protein